MNKHVSLGEKLSALQASDSFRKWHSLDDQRVCILCEKVITGRMIDVQQDSKGNYWLNCPTSGCAGSPRDWFREREREKAGRSTGPEDSASQIQTADFDHHSNLTR